MDCTLPVQMSQFSKKGQHSPYIWTPSSTSGPSIQDALELSRISSGSISTTPQSCPSRVDQPSTSIPHESPQTSSKQRSRKRRTVLKALSLRVGDCKPVLVLENSGSVARDHLASERTFLAYVRTSLAIASTGVALVQLFTITMTVVEANLTDSGPATKRFRKFAHSLGATMVICGLAVLGVGVFRYFSIQNALVKGMFPAARLCVVGMTGMLVTITIIIFVVLVSARS